MSLINRSAVKSRLLECAQNLRFKKFNRVSEATLNKLERKLDAAIQHHVMSIPSKGKTL